tara:strand:+ start:35 stop:556 length:522 start_codon:yes stop_codon:yes gene_type:complete
LAKNLYDVKFSTNFDFGKLADKMTDILGEQNESIIDSLAQMTKRNITDGNLRGLSESTLIARRKGRTSFDGHRPSPTTETRPLLYTGRLLKSIKPVEDGIEMLDYGLEHNDGFKTPPWEIRVKIGSSVVGLGSSKKVFPRTFIAGEKELKRDKKQLEKVQDDLIAKMEMVMKK